MSLVDYELREEIGRGGIAIESECLLYPVKTILQLAGGKQRGNWSGTMDDYRKIVSSLGFNVDERSRLLESVGIENARNEKGVLARERCSHYSKYRGN